MRRGIAFIIVVTGVLACLACSEAPDLRSQEDSSDSSVENTETGEDVMAARVRAHHAAAGLAGELTTLLLRELRAGDAATAVQACSSVAQELAREKSTDDMIVRRTSLHGRNPANAPDAFERATLEKFEESTRQGRVPSEIVEVESTPEGRRLRYLRPLVASGTCLQCHGPEKEMEPELLAAIRTLYPEDRATGHEAGDLRGAISVTVRLDGSAVDSGS